MAVEREVKLGVWPGFTLPDLADVAEGVVLESSPEVRLDATYHDTPDLRLARWGITLRHRSGEGEDRWTLKLPMGQAGDALVRDEIDVAGDATSVPAEIHERVAAWVRSATMQPVARLQTLRTRTVVLDGNGKELAEIVDDEVSVLDGQHLALRFREVEVELAPEAGERLLGAVVARLRAAGAGAPDPTPKVVRALGPRALAPPELVEPELERDATAADVLRAGITRAALRLLEHDAALRLTDDAEAVHQARVATRRLRSDLQTFAPLVDVAWAAPLRAELKWFADLLGAVRDTDVLAEHVTAELAHLDAADAKAGRPLLAQLRKERRDARAALLSAMRSQRYLELLDTVVDAAIDPRVLPDASERATAALPSLASAPWSKLRRAVKRAGDDAPDEVLHGIRIRAKRCRYAADVAALIVGKPAIRFSEAIAGLQDVLGAHQDACVRAAWLRGAASTVAPDTTLVAGQLIAMARDEARAHRTEWRRAWKKADEGKIRAWLTH